MSVIEHNKMTLRAVIQDQFPDDRISLDFAQMVIAKLASLIKRMQRKSIVHRNISIDTITLSASSTEPCGFKLGSLIGMEYARRL